MKKEIIETDITEETINHGEDSTTYTLKELRDFIDRVEKKGATHIHISTSMECNYGDWSCWTDLTSTQERLETDEEFNRRLQIQESAKREKKIQDTLLKKQQLAKEKELFLKLKQKFEK